MNKCLKFYLFSLIICCLLTMFIKSNAYAGDLTYKKSISMSKNQKLKYPLETATGVELSQTKYSTSKKAVVSVTKDGNMIAKKSGKATITVDIIYNKDGDEYSKTLKTVVSVKKGSVKLSETNKTMDVGDKFTLKLLNFRNKKIKWENDNTSAIKIADYGKGYVKLKAVGDGVATITCKYNGKTYTCKITVGTGDEEEYYFDENDGED